MKNVSYWLPPDVNCAYQVFSVDDYEEIVHSNPMQTAIPPSLQAASPARQASFYYGRHCASQALAALGASTPAPLERSPDGLAVWPEDRVGSITHAAQDRYGIAIAVAASIPQATAIAIDCEPLFSAEHATEITSLIASPTELQLGLRLGYSHPRWLTMVYSLKETLYKLLYEHVRGFMPFEAAELLSFDAETGQACLILRTAWGDLAVGQRHWLQVRMVSVDHIGESALSFGILRP